VLNQLRPNRQLEERAGYFPVSGAYLYSVLHEVKDPMAHVLLAGPFASERNSSYLPWVRWARSLAEGNIEVLLYGYCGIGKSIGVFEQRSSFEVDGYRWPVKLWRDSLNITLPASLENEKTAARRYNRPVKIETLTCDPAPLAKGGLAGYNYLKDFNWLSAPGREWIAWVASQFSRGIADWLGAHFPLTKFRLSATGAQSWRAGDNRRNSRSSQTAHASMDCALERR
jgi:hypothetical protein